MLKSTKARYPHTFGTAVDWRGSIIEEGNAWGKAKGINVDWARFADRWRSGYTPGGCSNCSMRSIPSQAARSCVRLPSCRISALPPVPGSCHSGSPAVV